MNVDDVLALLAQNHQPDQAFFWTMANTFYKL